MTDSKLEPNEDILQDTTGRKWPAGKTANRCLRNLAVAFLAIGLAPGLSCQAKGTDRQPPEPPARISAEQVNQRKQQADEEFDRGRRASKMRQLAAAIRHWKKALTMYRKLRDTDREQAGCYGNIGAALLESGKYKEALKENKAALAHFAKVRKTEREQAACHQNIGFSLMGLGRYQEAIEELKKSLAMFEELPGTEDKQAQCKLNIMWCETARDTGLRVLP